MAVKMTVSSTPIIGQIAWLLGWLMTGIFWIISQMGIPNVGLSIIIFTVIILMAMMPLQIKEDPETLQGKEGPGFPAEADG